MSEGFVYQKADRRRRTKRWYAVVTVNGTRRFEAAEPNTRDAAKRLLAELQRDRDAGVFDSRDLTLGAFLQSWLTTVRPSLAPATWKQHESIVRLHITPLLGHRLLSELSVGDVRRFLDSPTRDRTGRVGRLDAQTRRHHRATLRRALSDAIRDGLIARNVAGLAEPPKLGRKERTVLTADQARVLIEGTRDDRLWAFWVLAVTTGMREAEMLGLQWEDIAGSSVHVRHTLHWLPAKDEKGQPILKPNGKPVYRPGLMEPKTPKSRRTIPLTPVAVEALDSFRKVQLAERIAAGRPGKGGMVFTNRHGYSYRGNNMVAMLHAVTDRLGLPRVTVHDLRHSCATVLYGMGVPIEVIADILGHSSTRVTADLYRHRVSELAEDAAAAMQRAVG